MHFMLLVLLSMLCMDGGVNGARNITEKYQKYLKKHAKTSHDKDVHHAKRYIQINMSLRRRKTVKRLEQKLNKGSRNT